MKFAIIDANNLVHRAKHVIKDYGNFDDAVGMILSIVFNSMKKSYEKFGADHAVVCFDSYSWRKDVYSDYKADRPKKDARFEVIVKVLNDFRDFLRDCTNVTVLEREGIEADDFIARWTQIHDDPAFQHVIISADGDFKQLVREGVDLYDPIRLHLYTSDGVYFQDGKKIGKGIPTVSRYDQVWKVKLDKKTGKPVTFDPEWEIFYLCVRGRKNNMLPAWPGVWETKMRAAFETKGTDNPMKWNNFINNIWKAPDGSSVSVRGRYEINLLLTDLRRQPPEILDKIDTSINEALNRERKRMVGAYFTRFCGKYNLPRLAQSPYAIVQLLSSPYEV